MYPINKPEVMIGNAAQRFDAGGNLDESTKKHIRQLLSSLVDWTLGLERIKATDEIREAG
jgi:chromate reductase